MKHNHGGLEDHFHSFSFLNGWFLGSILIYRGVLYREIVQFFFLGGGTRTFWWYPNIRSCVILGMLKKGLTKVHSRTLEGLWGARKISSEAFPVDESSPSIALLREMTSFYGTSRGEVWWCSENTLWWENALPYHPWDWYIYLHLVDFYGKCREIYHTWIVWDC